MEKKLQKERELYHELAFVCSHVFENAKPVLYVSKEDGEWQFLCGENHAEGELPRVVGLGHLLERDSSLFQILDLKDDWDAERRYIGDKWVISECK